MPKIYSHIANLIFVIIFSFLSAQFINQIVIFFIKPTVDTSSSVSRYTPSYQTRKSFNEYQAMLDSNFFKVASPDSSDSTSSSSELSELIVLGTISGPPSIARALIKKQNEPTAQIYSIGMDVHGFKLVRIDNAKVYLKKGEKIEIIDMFAKEKSPTNPQSTPSSGESNRVIKNISKSEIQQKVLNNLDNALNGVKAGPYRVGGKIEGYKLFSVAPFNILYSIGARSGDIVKKVNGITIDSTEKLMKMWETLKTENRFVIELERSGQTIVYDLNIKE